MNLQVGSKIRILNRDNYIKWADRIWKVFNIAHSKKDHPGYDFRMNGMALVSCDGLPVSLYTHEFEIVE